MAKNPYLRPNPPKLPTNTLHKSAGMLGEHAVRKVVHTKEFRISEVWHAYGGFQDVNYVLPILATTWTHMKNLTNDLWGGLHADGLNLINDEMIIINKAHYFGAVSITFSALATKNYKIRLRNITQNKTMGYVIGVTTTGATNFTNVSLPIYIEANAGDVLQMQMRCEDATDPKLRSSVFWLNYLHE